MTEDTQDRDKRRKYVDGVANPRGSRTAEEENRTEQNWHVECLSLGDGVEGEVADGDGCVASNHLTRVRQLSAERFDDVHRDERVR